MFLYDTVKKKIDEAAPSMPDWKRRFLAVNFVAGLFLCVLLSLIAVLLCGYTKDPSKFVTAHQERTRSFNGERF